MLNPYPYTEFCIINMGQLGQLSRYSDDPVSIPGTARFSLLHVVQTGSCAHPASYPMVPVVISSGVKRPRRKADHSPPTSAETKNGGAILPLPICLHGILLN
jgi:hypothetical protein